MVRLAHSNICIALLSVPISWLRITGHPRIVYSTYQPHRCTTPLRWRQNERDGVSNHRRLYCLLNRVCRRQSQKISQLPVTGLWAGNSPVTGEFPAQRASKRKMFPFDDVFVTLLTFLHATCRPYVNVISIISLIYGAHRHFNYTLNIIFKSSPF